MKKRRGSKLTPPTGTKPKSTRRYIWTNYVVQMYVCIHLRIMFAGEREGVVTRLCLHTVLYRTNYVYLSITTV